ncbi:MAG: type II secretion system protein [Snowella sp.]|nr:type II secretion system protein [Snowella sp.]
MMIRVIHSLGWLPKQTTVYQEPRQVASQGWTLLELAIVSVIAGILASLAIPSMMAMAAKSKVQAGLAQVKGALQEAQRSAIRMGKECRVSVNAGSNPPSIAVVDSSYAGCLSQTVVLTDLSMLENFNGANIRFSYKGNTNNWGTIIIHSPNTTTRHCLVISALGIMRSGVYTGTVADATSAYSDNCKSSL